MGIIYAAIVGAALILAIRGLGLRVRAPIQYGRLIGLTAIFIGLLIGGWFILTSGERIEDRILSPVIMPSPTEVLASLPTLHTEQALVQSIFTSWWRVTYAFLIAVLLAVPLGVLMASFTPVAAFFRPLSLIGSYVPIVCFIPLTMAWWGIEESQKTGFLSIACFVVLLPLVIKSIVSVPDALVDVSVTKGANNWQLLRHVLFPVAKADIWDHMRGVYGVGWGWIVLAEQVNAEKGLGQLIWVSEKRSNQPALWASIIVIVLIAILCDKIWQWGGKRLFPYRAA